jgi:hypothetical protein
VRGVAVCTAVTAGARYVNAAARAADPDVVTTVTPHAPAAAPAGVRAVSDVLPVTVTLVAAREQTRTVAPATRLVPVTVRSVLPPRGPVDGVTAVTDGTAGLMSFRIVTTNPPSFDSQIRDRASDRPRATAGDGVTDAWLPDGRRRRPPGQAAWGRG